MQAEENLGMAMMYTLATSAKEWLRERYNQNLDSISDGESDVEAKDEVNDYVLHIYGASIYETLLFLFLI